MKVAQIDAELLAETRDTLCQLSGKPYVDGLIAKLDAVIGTTKPQEKPRVIVGTIGHVGEGKTTLTAAIAAVLSRDFGPGSPGGPASTLEATPHLGAPLTDAQADEVIKAHWGEMKGAPLDRHRAYIRAVQAALANPAAADGIAGLVSRSSWDDAEVVLRFIDDEAAARFMEDDRFAPTVDHACLTAASEVK